MLFIQAIFLFVFLPAALVAFYLAGAKIGRLSALCVILAASLVFYLPNGKTDFLLLSASVAVNFAIGTVLTAAKINGRPRAALLIAGMLYNFGMLIVFKYTNAVLQLFEGSAYAPIIAAAIPAGISFYTFHEAVFLLDCYNRKAETIDFLQVPSASGPLGRVQSLFQSLVSYASFVVFFPQLVIGPISYLKEMAPQLTAKTFGKLNRLDLEVGLTLLAIGLFKKLVIADNVATFVNPLFYSLSVGNTLSPLNAWVASLGYLAQLYFDFSGYTDAALGIGRLFGLQLPRNFDSPLRATGIADYYRRWHMTLTRVIVRFLFTPLSLWGTRYTAAHGWSGWHRRILSSWLPLWLNFEVIALWHGATTTFIAFGCAHGCWYVLETEIRSTKSWRRYRAATSEFTRRTMGQIVTFLPLMLTFSLFRSDGLGSFGRLVKSLFSPQTANVVTSLEPFQWAALIGAFAIVWLLPNSSELLAKFNPSIETFSNPSSTPSWFRFEWRRSPIWAAFVMMLLAVSFWHIAKFSPFLYGGF